MALGVCFPTLSSRPSSRRRPASNCLALSERTLPPAAQPAAPEEPLPALLAKANPTKGQADAKACEACHSFAKGGTAKVGPPLWGVVGRPIASIAGFSYSDALKTMGGDWTYEKLNDWVHKPSAVAPGTKMSYPGDPAGNHRADLLSAYLQTLHRTAPFRSQK